MKKIFVTLFLTAFSILMLNVTKASTSQDQLPANCIAYNDGCNTCARGSLSGQWACTLKACLDTQVPTYTCTAYATGETAKVEQKVCTMEYAPVCGAYKPTINCLVAPCPAVDPVVETYSNKCMMEAAGATYLYDGACGGGNPEPVVCTKEYMPVCGAVQVECIKAPCPPVPQTFGNACMLKAAGNATMLYAGECKGDLQAGEGSAYNSVASILDKSYLAWQFTPIQAANYTQTIIDKIDNFLQVSKMKQRAYNKHLQLKRFLQLYITLGQK